MNITNEWGKLKLVILGSSQKYLYYNKTHEQYKIYKETLNKIKLIMEKYNIKVIFPNYIKDLHIIQSLWVRDSSIIIDKQPILLQLDNFENKLRKLEYKTINFPKYILQNNDKIKLEGGDIIQMNDIIFVGIHKRSNIYGYRWLKQLFPNKRFIQIKHKALHLDCCFCILPNKTILYSKKYIETLPQFCYKHFNCINIDKYIKGDPNLATNFLFLDENNILIEQRFTPIIKILKQFNFNIITIDLKDIWKEGGSIRCLTQPLLRE